MPIRTADTGKKEWNEVDKMCTCMTYENGDFYFGRNMDLDESFREKVVITPGNYQFTFQKMPDMKRHYSMIGMAAVHAGYPLYAEAVNEAGLAVAGLRFPGNAVYKKECPGRHNVAPYELIPWLLGQCASVREVRELLKDVNILKIQFHRQLPLVPLHWMAADRESCIVLEPLEEGLRVYENPYGILTNSPPFWYYRMHMGNYRNLTAGVPGNQFARKLDLPVCGQGVGGFGLPGDYSPVSRFVKAVFLRWNARAEKEELSSVGQFFHMLDAVAMVRGAVLTEEGRADITTYSCCVNVKTGVYYYKTYENSQIQAVSLRGEDSLGKELRIFELESQPSVVYHNRKKRKIMETEIMKIASTHSKRK